METIIKKPIYNILELFYENKNQPLHLRDIARKVNLNESSVSRHLNFLVKKEILKQKLDGNLKKFCLSINQISNIFLIYDNKKINSLPLLRKKAIEMYLEKLSLKPIFVVLFGSTAKGTFRNNSDLDFLEVYNSKPKNNEAPKYVESQTGIKINSFQLTEKQFKEELRTEKDKTISSAINTGFPVFNQKHYWSLIYNG
ncbi:MAG: nucleotidyltransferase domain-containing protein [Nanoarchaeota archaeon]|nr:nucleotidyltransferase domain-containing protein [Nanoarchaeota archaeon]